MCRIMMIHHVDPDPRPWIRVQTFGRERKQEEKTSTWKPEWLDSRKRSFLQEKPGKNHEEFWVDLYNDDILYILRHPLIMGKMNKKDEEEITQLWGGSLKIFLVCGQSL